MCGDTGLPRWYVKIGNEARIEGGPVALEAALRRPAGAAPADNAPSVAPEPPVRERGATPRSEPPIAPPPAPAASPKSSFENLEDEMASLLGRPKSSSS